MELYPGTSLSKEQLEKSACNSKYNTVKKAFSEFTGRPYKIPSIYNKNKTIKFKKQNNNNNTRNNRQNNVNLKNNYTRKNIY